MLTQEFPFIISTVNISLAYMSTKSIAMIFVDPYNDHI